MSNVTMNRAGYELIAHVIKTARAAAADPVLSTPRQRQGAERALSRLAEDFAAELRATNPRFDRERFLEACDPAGTYRNKSRASKRLTPIGRSSGPVSEDIGDDDSVWIGE
jgi:hypothetical protein